MFGVGSVHADGRKTAALSRGCLVLRDGCLCEVRSGVCSCWHEVFVGRCCQFLRWPPHTVFLLGWSGDFQAPSVTRKHGFRSVGFRLQLLSWVKSVHCVWQTADLVVGSESEFWEDKLHHKDTVLVWDVSRRDFLCYSQAGPARVSNVLVLFLCLRIGSLSPLFHLFVRLHPWLCVSLCPCIGSLSVVAEPYFLVPRYRGFSLWCCPLLSRLAGGGPEGSDGSAVKEDGSVVAWSAYAS